MLHIENFKIYDVKKDHPEYTNNTLEFYCGDYDLLCKFTLIFNSTLKKFKFFPEVKILENKESSFEWSDWLDCENIHNAISILHDTYDIKIYFTLFTV